MSSVCDCCICFAKITQKSSSAIKILVWISRAMPVASRRVWIFFVALIMVRFSNQQPHNEAQDSLDVIYKINGSFTECQTYMRDSGQNFDASHCRELYSAIFKRSRRKSQAEKFAKVKLWPYVVMAISSLLLFI